MNVDKTGWTFEDYAQHARDMLEQFRRFSCEHNEVFTAADFKPERFGLQLQTISRDSSYE